MLVTLRAATPPSRNNLSRANKERDATLAERIFWSGLGHLQTLQPAFARGNRGKGVARCFPRVIHVVDSTTIQLVASCSGQQALRYSVWAAPRVGQSLCSIIILFFLANVN
jgi:hypothetical protein